MNFEEFRVAAMRVAPCVGVYKVAYQEFKPRFDAGESITATDIHEFTKRVFENPDEMIPERYRADFRTEMMRSFLETDQWEDNFAHIDTWWIVGEVAYLEQFKILNPNTNQAEQYTTLEKAQEARKRHFNERYGPTVDDQIDRYNIKQLQRVFDETGSELRTLQPIDNSKLEGWSPGTDFLVYDPTTGENIETIFSEIFGIIDWLDQKLWNEWVAWTPIYQLCRHVNVDPKIEKWFPNLTENPNKLAFIGGQGKIQDIEEFDPDLHLLTHEQMVALDQENN